MERINLRQRAKHLLRLYGFFPKKRLGQNFSVNLDILKRLVSCARLTKDDVVLEVGAGFGFLTQLLSDECKKVVAVEVDQNLITFLKTQLNSLKNVELVEGDILKVSLPEFNKVVSAPPYSISSPLLFRLLENKFDVAVLILQKEFAERLAASVGSKDYGRLTVAIYYRAEVELLDVVPRTMFFPPPDVDSMIIRLKPRAPPFHVDDEEAFFEVVRVLFTQRNKKVRNSLIPFLRSRGFDGKVALEFADSVVYSEKRVRELAPEDFAVLTNDLLQKLSLIL
ncbi:MAG: 16S rRNA (adenine(1518)-N(6)/adenine(1519)-N(6))-dimethyltransferase RsmA [Candidatus Bathyarchaeota archaeon]|nr:16S rRNA (adenine(1518)-N(6)/adenine(1519)-N(6))-dimethyltransferase RsmA [Candidatus Bathyarchaeota archaeon]